MVLYIPRFPLKGSFKGDIDLDVDEEVLEVEVDVDIASTIGGVLLKGFRAPLKGFGADLRQV